MLIFFIILGGRSDRLSGRILAHEVSTEPSDILEGKVATEVIHRPRFEVVAVFHHVSEDFALFDVVLHFLSFLSSEGFSLPVTIYYHIPVYLSTLFFEICGKGELVFTLFLTQGLTWQLAPCGFPDA